MIPMATRTWSPNYNRLHLQSNRNKLKFCRDNCSLIIIVMTIFDPLDTRLQDLEKAGNKEKGICKYMLYVLEFPNSRYRSI